MPLFIRILSVPWAKASSWLQWQRIGNVCVCELFTEYIEFVKWCQLLSSSCTKCYYTIGRELFTVEDHISLQLDTIHQCQRRNPWKSLLKRQLKPYDHWEEMAKHRHSSRRQLRPFVRLGRPSRRVGKHGSTPLWANHDRYSRILNNPNAGKISFSPLPLAGAGASFQTHPGSGTNMASRGWELVNMGAPMAFVSRFASECSCDSEYDDEYLTYWVYSGNKEEMAIESRYSHRWQPPSATNCSAGGHIRARFFAWTDSVIVSYRPGWFSTG